MKRLAWGHRAEASFLTFLGQRFAGARQSVVCEEMIGAAKNGKQIRGSKIYRRPEASMASVLTARVPAKRHRYELCEPNVALPQKSRRLNEGSVGEVPVAPSLDLGGIVTTSQKAPFYSPKPSNIGVSVGDLEVMTHRNLWNDLSTFTRNLHGLLQRLPSVCVSLREEQRPRFLGLALWLVSHERFCDNCAPHRARLSTRPLQRSVR